MISYCLELFLFVYRPIKLIYNVHLITGSSASGSSRKDKDRKKTSPHGSGGSDTETVASSRLDGSEAGPKPGLGVPQDMSASRQSFRMAMGNPCEFFVDVM